MSLWDDSKLRDKIQKSSTSYQDVVNIARQARHLSNQCNFYIRESEALTWVIQGKKPHNVQPSTGSKVITRFEYNYMEDVLCQVDDIDIKESVRESYRASKLSRKLLYIYKNVPDESRRSRVRVIVNILWYNNKN